MINFIIFLEIFDNYIMNEKHINDEVQPISNKRARIDNQDSKIIVPTAKYRTPGGIIRFKFFSTDDFVIFKEKHVIKKGLCNQCNVSIHSSNIINKLLKKVNLRTMTPNFQKYILNIILTLRRYVNNDVIYMILERLEFPDFIHILNKQLLKLGFSSQLINCIESRIETDDGRSKLLPNLLKSIIKYQKLQQRLFSFETNSMFDFDKGIIYNSLRSSNTIIYNDNLNNFLRFVEIIYNAFGDKLIYVKKVYLELKGLENLIEKINLNYNLITNNYYNDVGLLYNIIEEAYKVREHIIVLCVMTIISNSANMTFCKGNICLNQEFRYTYICPNLRETQLFQQSSESVPLDIYNFAEAFGNKDVKFPINIIDFLNLKPKSSKIKTKSYNHKLDNYQGMFDNFLKKIDLEVINNFTEYLPLRAAKPKYKSLTQEQKSKLSYDFARRRSIQMEIAKEEDSNDSDDEKYDRFMDGYAIKYELPQPRS